MKFLLFYTSRKIKRRPLHFLAMLLICAVILFCLTDLILLLEGTSIAYDMANTDMEESIPKSRFLSGSAILLLIAHALLLAVNAAVMTSNNMRHHAEEHRILWELGVHPHRMLASQLTESALAFAGGCLTGIPMSILFMSRFTLYIRSHLVQPAMYFRIPLLPSCCAVILLFFALMLGTAIPYLRKADVPHLSPSGRWNTAYPPMRMFCKLWHKRQCRHHLSDPTVIFAIQILPILFLIAAFSFSPIPEPDYDCTVTVREDSRQLISEQLAQQLCEIPGIASADMIQHSYREEKCYSAVRIKFEPDAREDGIHSVATCADTEYYCVTDLFHRAQQASEKNEIYRKLFFLIAGILFITALPLIFLVLSSSFQGMEEILGIFYTVGLSHREIHRFFLSETLRRLCFGGAAAFLVASLCFAIMEVEGGGSLPTAGLLAAALLYLTMQLLLGILTARGNYRHFLNTHLHHRLVNVRE